MSAPNIHPLLADFFPRATPTPVTPLVEVSSALVPSEEQRFIDSALRRWQPKLRRSGRSWEITVPAAHTPDRIEAVYHGAEGATLAETIHAMEALFAQQAAVIREKAS
ncbi:MAG TPA: hypothetical protein VFM71_11460 [Gemmatimonadaceae bacterium]|nr:hypothetical protein [Gemmatimonadaceae bacterium]